MKIVYLFSGVDKENGFNELQAKYLKEDIKDNLTIAFLASFFDNYERNDFQLEKILNWFSNIGINFKNNYLIDKRTSKEQAKEYIEKADVIYVMGGSPLIQMENIKNYDLTNILKERNGITIGVSAGSMNCANKIIYEDETVSSAAINYEGIGLTDISIYPHLDFTNLDYLKELFRISKNHKVIALPNNSFIKIKDCKEEYIGDYYEVNNETINMPQYQYEEIKHTGTIELETDRLLLRRTKLSDLDEFFYIQLNPNLRRYLGPTKLGSNLEKEKKYFDETKYNNLNYYRWTIVKKEDNKILGTIYLNIHDEKAKVAGIDYWIRQDEWGCGYVTEAAQCVLDFAFKILDLNRIESCGAKDNAGTWKVMEKIGLKYEGYRQQAYFYYYGGIQDLVLYGLTKDEYLKNKVNKLGEWR